MSAIRSEGVFLCTKNRKSTIVPFRYFMVCVALIIESSLVEKATDYVKLNAQTKEFYLTKEADKYLTASEIEQVQRMITLTNTQFAPYKAEMTPANGVLVPAADQRQAQAEAINHNLAFDWTLTWFGMRLYWSHSFCEKLSNNLILFGAGVAGLNAAISATLSYFSITPPGWLTSFITAIASLSVWAFLQQDEGCGVYLDCVLYVPTRWYTAC